MAAVVADAPIGIQTPSGVVRCQEDEIVCRRFGVHLKRRLIILEYEVPRLTVLAHHCIEVDSDNKFQEFDDTTVAENLKGAHGPWLRGVSVAQLARLVARLRAPQFAPPKRAAAETTAAEPPVAETPAAEPPAAAETPAEQSPAAAKPAPARKRRPRSQGLPSVARARAASNATEVQKVFNEMAGSENPEVLPVEDFRCFLGDHLGFGQAEVARLLKDHGENPESGLTVDELKKCYGKLNPFMVARRKQEVIIRKPGSLHGQQINLDSLEDCDTFICDVTAQVFLDFCKRSVILVAPCESSVFVRDCEDCIFWIAAQQLRTRDCKRCTFYLYSKTEPIIETSEELAFAPWSARYPGCKEHFERVKFDPQKNVWNALYDFNGEAGHAHWRILPLEEVVELKIELDEAPETAREPDNPCPEVTHDLLCAAPIASGEGCGQSVTNVPQTRPDLPPAPASKVEVPVCCIQDEAEVTRSVGATAKMYNRTPP
mmetsp:Transcript_41665/g.75638  ORF Transcript_41665/g.75638 Transcript_41665/m.75638 type:complete len:487 (+) Transcript_41665:78-1538(+)